MTSRREAESITNVTLSDTTVLTIEPVPSSSKDEQHDDGDTDGMASYEEESCTTSVITHEHDVYAAAAAASSHRSIELEMVTSDPLETAAIEMADHPPIITSTITSPTRDTNIENNKDHTILQSPSSPYTDPSSPTASSPPVPNSSSLDWLSSLRAEWSAVADTAPRSKPIVRPRRARTMSPGVTSIDPLQGDVVWNPTTRRITIDEYEDFLIDSKLNHFRFHRMVRQIISMFRPTFILCLLILIYSETCVKHELNSHLAWKILVYKEHSEDTTLSKFSGSLLNALTVMCAIFLITIIFIIFYYFQRILELRRFLITIIMTLLIGPWLYFSFQMIEYYSITIDMLSYTFIMAQFFGCGYISLVMFGETPSEWNRMYLIFIGLSVTWPFMEFTEWTVWTTIIVLTIYDLLAVLCPCGPLKWIMDQESKKKSNIRPPLSSRMPGMMYVGEYFSLGLGDIIFYGALMGRAAHEGFITLVTCCIGVLMGVAGTILWSYHTTAHAIPALPLSVLFGLTLYATTSLTVLPMIVDATKQGWQA